MGRNRQDDFHNGRAYDAGEPMQGVFGWLGQQVDKLFKVGHEQAADTAPLISENPRR